MLKLKYITVNEAKAIKDALSARALPSINRVLVFSPGEDDLKLSSGIIIPGTAKEDRPRKGVIISTGKLDEDHEIFNDYFSCGTLITYGLYAGKEVEFDWSDITISDELKSTVENGKFTILDTNEIVMFETNRLS
jgi:co-chaperonin GroES (HSP10)